MYLIIFIAYARSIMIDLESYAYHAGMEQELGDRVVVGGWGKDAVWTRPQASVHSLSICLIFAHNIPLSDTNGRSINIYQITYNK